MNKRCVFYRLIRVDGHTSASMLDEADLAEAVTKATRDESTLRVEIERGDLDDLILDYHASQLRVYSPVECRFPHVDRNLRLWTPWTGALQMMTANDDNLAGYNGPPADEVLYVEHPLLGATIIFGPYIHHAARCVRHTIENLDQQHLWLLPMEAPAADLAVVVAYWGDGEQRGRRRCVRSASIGWAHKGKLPEWWLHPDEMCLFAHRTPSPEYVMGIQVWPLVDVGGGDRPSSGVDGEHDAAEDMPTAPERSPHES